MTQINITIDHAQLAEYCHRWQITELALFGSVINGQFRPDSDVDVLITFAPDNTWTLLDLDQMEEELAAIFQRPIDLQTRFGVEHSRNPLRRQSILESAQVIYAAA